MAKINCPICGNEIYTTDTKCINCGSDRKTIEFELKRNEFVDKGQIKNENSKKKGIIIAVELGLILTSIIAYSFLFMPRVVTEIENHKKVVKEDKCTKDSGNWNADLNECITANE